MRIRDWSSDVCSSDLLREPHGQGSLRPNFSVSSLCPWTTRRPFLTWVSEGKPLRRLLVTSKGSLVWIDALHDGSPISPGCGRSEEHTSELQSLMRISYAVFCLKKKKNTLSMTMTHTK